MNSLKLFKPTVKLRVCKNKEYNAESAVSRRPLFACDGFVSMSLQNCLWMEKLRHCIFLSLYQHHYLELYFSHKGACVRNFLVELGYHCRKAVFTMRFIGANHVLGVLTIL